MPFRVWKGLKKRRYSAWQKNIDKGLKDHGSDESQKTLDCIKELGHGKLLNTRRRIKILKFLSLYARNLRQDVFVEIDDDAARFGGVSKNKKMKDNLNVKEA